MICGCAALNASPLTVWNHRESASGYCHDMTPAFQPLFFARAVHRERCCGVMYPFPASSGMPGLPMTSLSKLMLVWRCIWKIEVRESVVVLDLNSSVWQLS